MDIGLREWLIVIGIIVIAGILFDGWRRMRGGKGKLKFKLDRSLSNLPDADDSPELLGPARVVNRDHEPSLDEGDMPTMSARESGKKRRQNEPFQGDLQLNSDEPVPTLLDPVVGDDEEGKDQPQKELTPVEEVLVINVICRDPHGFRGPALLQNILESGLRFGEMDIFHRHESMAGNGEVLFSMANAVKPGTFDLDDIDHFTTPAVSFFLGLPGPRHPKQAFDVMVAAARKLSQELNGELKDDQRSVLTAQTIEHYRQRIVEFERRQMTIKQR
ncbi:MULTISPECIES: cell division protein ZipA [Stutzerimonas stutzeri subgroup]|jgi:cell division protein ZipA|uniref:Cell division protein ZipA n=1 Tax=Stutzerimonas stutzeri CCUG 29243 TaxID=1196835 RepID=I4CTY7_STUST|nr:MULTISPECIES: cell division protein ZipA [Stutzerimonas stutzeri subgroup]MBU0562143.1 cell division protein ZipA [Gammaproteobacteria bacterium]AFM33544.1 cell division protein ZipA [Stutzerimonas stutzeri CCUG 29243]MBU0836668.1 cell division protein ZipA [Gammaproteobacteria bacterium]MBU1804439.1 cell division protein ZipA [Gammaproteobacteria bacterium]MCQ2038085.1 cell division protein ZipA [Stutzerimonas kunmingensis]